MNTRLILISCLSLASVLAPAYAASTTNTPSLAGLTNPPIVPGVVRIQSNSVVTAGGASNIYNALVGIGSIFGAPFTNLTIGSTDYLTLTLSSGGTGATLSITGGNITNLASFMGSNLLVVTPAFAATNYLSLSSWSSWLSTNGLASLAAVNSLFQQTTNDFNALLAGMPSFSGTNFWSATGSNAFNGPVGMGVLSMTNYTAYSNGVQTIDGTITVSSSSSNVVGAPGSLFLSQVAVGNILYSGNDSIYVAEGIVASIESDEALTLQTNAVNNYSGVGAGIDAMLPYTRPPRLIFPDGEQSNAFLATSTQLNSIFGYTPLDTSAFTGFSNLVLSAGYLTAESNWLFDAIGSAATVQSNLNATWNGSTNKYMGGDLTLTGTVQVAAIVWSNVGSTLLTTQTMAGITNLVSTTGAQSFAITNGSVFVTDTNFTLANFAPTTATQIVTNNGSGYTVDFTLATGPTALLSNQFTTLGQLDDKLNAIVGEVWFGTTNIHPNTLLVGDLQFTRTAVDAWTNTYSATAASNYLGTLYMTNPIVGGITAGPYIHTVYAAVSSAAGSPAYHSRLVMSDGTTTNVLGVGTSFPLTTKAQANDSSMFLSTNVVVSATNMFLGISRYVTRTVGGGTASIYGGTGFFTHLTLPSTTFNSSYTLTAAEMTSVIPTLVTNTTIDGFGINNGTLTGVVAAVTYDSVTNVLGGRPVEVVMGVYTCTNSETAVNIGPIGNYGSNTYLWVATLSALTATNVQSDYNMCKVNNIGTGGYMIAGVRFQGNATVNFQDNAPIYFDNVSGYRTPRFSFGKIRFDNYWQSAGTIGGSNIVANFSTEFYKQVVNTPGPNEQKLWGYVSPWSGTNSLPITNLTIYTNSGNGWTNGSKIVWGIGYLSQ